MWSRTRGQGSRAAVQRNGQRRARCAARPKTHDHPPLHDGRRRWYRRNSAGGPQQRGGETGQGLTSTMTCRAGLGSSPIAGRVVLSPRRRRRRRRCCRGEFRLGCRYVQVDRRRGVVTGLVSSRQRSPGSPSQKRSPSQAEDGSRINQRQSPVRRFVRSCFFSLPVALRRFAGRLSALTISKLASESDDKQAQMQCRVAAGLGSGRRRVIRAARTNVVSSSPSPSQLTANGESRAKNSRVS